MAHVPLACTQDLVSVVSQFVEPVGWLGGAEDNFHLVQVGGVYLAQMGHVYLVQMGCFHLVQIACLSHITSRHS